MLRKSLKTLVFLSVTLMIAVACNSEQETTENPGQYNQHRAEISADLEPLSIEYRKDTCTFDDKEIRSKRFGAELTTEQGNHHKFCSAEHMVAYMMKEDINEENAKVRVVEFIDGGKLIDPTKTTVLKTPNQPSPGGMNFLPMASGQNHSIQRMHELYTGELLTWEEAKQHVADNF